MLKSNIIILCLSLVMVPINAGKKKQLPAIEMKTFQSNQKEKTEPSREETVKIIKQIKKRLPWYLKSGDPTQGHNRRRFSSMLSYFNPFFWALIKYNDLPSPAKAPQKKKMEELILLFSKVLDVNSFKGVFPLINCSQSILQNAQIRALPVCNNTLFSREVVGNIYDLLAYLLVSNRLRSSLLNLLFKQLNLNVNGSTTSGSKPFDLFFSPFMVRNYPHFIASLFKKGGQFNTHTFPVCQTILTHACLTSFKKRLSTKQEREQATKEIKKILPPLFDFTDNPCNGSSANIYFNGDMCPLSCPFFWALKKYNQETNYVKQQPIKELILLFIRAGIDINSFKGTFAFRKKINSPLVIPTIPLPELVLYEPEEVQGNVLDLTEYLYKKNLLGTSLLTLLFDELNLSVNNKTILSGKTPLDLLFSPSNLQECPKLISSLLKKGGRFTEQPDSFEKTIAQNTTYSFEDFVGPHNIIRTLHPFGPIKKIDNKKITNPFELLVNAAGPKRKDLTGHTMLHLLAAQASFSNPKVPVWSQRVVALEKWKSQFFYLLDHPETDPETIKQTADIIKKNGNINPIHKKTLLGLIQSRVKEKEAA